MKTALKGLGIAVGFILSIYLLGILSVALMASSGGPQ